MFYASENLIINTILVCLKILIILGVWIDSDELQMKALLLSNDEWVLQTNLPMALPNSILKLCRFSGFW